MIAGTAMQGLANDMTLGASLWGQEANYRQEKANIKSQVAAYEYSARLSDRAAENTQNEMNAADERLRNNQKYERGAAITAYGKSGVALSGGSPLAVMAETAANQEIEVMELRREGAAKRQEYEQQAEIERYNARVAKAKLRSAQINNINANVGSVINWVGNAGSILSDFGSSRLKSK